MKWMGALVTLAVGPEIVPRQMLDSPQLPVTAALGNLSASFGLCRHLHTHVHACTHAHTHACMHTHK